MSDKLMKYEESYELYSKIANLITARKTAVSQAMNAAMIFLYWEIGETICQHLIKGFGDQIAENPLFGAVSEDFIKAL